MKKIINSPYTYIAIIFLITITYIISNTYAWFNWESISETRMEMKIGTLTQPTFDGTNNRPNLADGMIPIKYNGTTWVKADIKNTSNDWYDYNNKIWANAVMVTEGTRTQHMNNPVGTPVPEADILAYLVWIPRYKYQLFNVSFSQITQREIQIEFENGIETTGTVSCSTSNLGVETCTNKANGNWYTHPAFTFGDDELAGLWVGKFETAGNHPDTSQPLIKPLSFLYTNHAQLTYKNKNANKINTSFYVNANTDAHIMKNIEWGAVAYLTQSKYGRCTSGTCQEININNYFDWNNEIATGCSAAPGTSYSFYCTESYESVVGMRASTTGNIYGIYDMSGGGTEIMMSVVVNEIGVPYSGAYSAITPVCSGFSGPYYSGSGTYNGEPFPPQKYYDIYQYGITQSDQQAYNRSHLGDATGETRGWYGDGSYFTVSYGPWFTRGGASSSQNTAGIFDFSGSNGEGGTYSSYRIVLP